MKNRRASLWAAALLALAIPLCRSAALGASATPRRNAPLSRAVVYCVNAEIFSPDGLRGVTAQLGRIRRLGATIVWLMPIFPRGKACVVGGIARPSYDSPYCVSDMTAISPRMGTPADLTDLVQTAHRDGLRVILDVALNQTSWDNPLVARDPRMYRHLPGSSLSDVSSIEDGWGRDRDIAMLDCTTDRYGAQSYLIGVCRYWLRTYDLDGFRIDAADNPHGPARSLAQPFMLKLAAAMRAIDPNVVLLGEENDAALALAPYNLDYDWTLHGLLAQAHGRVDTGVSALRAAWESETLGWPAGMRHMLITQDWDMDSDSTQYGGPDQSLDAMLFDFTMPGAPLIYNGEEAGNNVGGDNTHDLIDWHGPNALRFERFVRTAAALSRSCPALTGSETTWLNAPVGDGQVALYERRAAAQTVLVEINFGSAPASGHLPSPFAGPWSDITPPGSPGAALPAAPSTGRFALAPYAFAVFRQSALGPSQSHTNP